jgi:hypothetical protein
VVVVAEDVLVVGEEVTATGSVTVGVGLSLDVSAAHADTIRAEMRDAARIRIGFALWHGLAGDRRNVIDVFGPLNGVRTALVVAAALAALVSLIAGYPAAALVLFVGIVAHGLGWLYLYVHRDEANTR